MQAYQLKEKTKLKHSARVTRNRGRLTQQLVTKDATTPYDSINKPAEPRSSHTVSTMQNPKSPEPPSKMNIETLINNLSSQMAIANKALSDEIKVVNTTVNTMNLTIESIRSDLKAHQQKVDTEIIELKDQNKSLDDKLSKAKERITTLENLYYDIYQKQEAKHKSKQALNVVIRGVPEVQNEKMYVTMSELLTPTQSIEYTQTNGATRMGKPPKSMHGQTGGQPRPIKLRCATVLQKGVIFRAVSKIKEIPKFQNVRITNELNKEDLMAHKEVQIIYTEAINIPNVQAKMKGKRIEIDGKVYERAKFDSLPHHEVYSLNCNYRPGSSIPRELL